MLPSLSLPESAPRRRKALGGCQAGLARSQAPKQMIAQGILCCYGWTVHQWGTGCHSAGKGSLPDQPHTPRA